MQGMNLFISIMSELRNINLQAGIYGLLLTECCSHFSEIPFHSVSIILKTHLQKILCDLCPLIHGPKPGFKYSSMLIVLVSCTSFFFFHGGGGGGEGGFYCPVQEMTRWTGYVEFLH